MNYRHAYHAGNHADILKHIVLTRIVEHLKKKDKPFRALDLHAGIGTYQLESDEALKTLEWQDGLGRLYRLDGTPVMMSAQAEALISPWRGTVASVNPPGPLATYPGSPALLRYLARPGDRMIFNELHPQDTEALAAFFARDRKVIITALDAAVAIKAQLPPPERRGLVLIDPPYEVTNEAERVITMLNDGLKRFGTGIFCIWYPITGDRLSDRLERAFRAMKHPQSLLVELSVRAATPEGGLSGSGLFIVNPPWQLDVELAVLLPELSNLLKQTEKPATRLDFI